MGTLDLAGIPLVSTMLRGSQNDSPVYVPVWRQMVDIIGRSDFLLVGDCKLCSLGNRVQLHLAGGLYPSPLTMTGQWPAVLRDWVLDPPWPVEDIYLPEQPPGEGPAYRGFVMELGTLAPTGYPDPSTQAAVGWLEQVFVVCNSRTAWREIQALHQRLVLLSVGLRVLTLVEFVVRRELDEQQEKLAGLYEGNRKRATDRPTTERLLRAFEGIVLYYSQSGEQVSHQLTHLTDLQKRILDLMSLPADLYARPVPGAEFAGTG